MKTSDVSDGDAQATLDPESYAQRRIASTQAHGAWQPQSLPEMERWQRRTRTRLRRLLGGLDQPRKALGAEILEHREFPGYRREKIRFHSREGLAALGYFLLPHGLPAKAPAILCLPGHGRGVDSIIGIGEDGSQRALDAPAEYQADFALQCVRHGYPVFALEQIGFGHRRDSLARNRGVNHTSCNRDSMAALMLGETMTGWRVWDAMRALDYLETRPEVERKRLGVMGISGGGLTALWTAALDRRVRAAVVSGYYNTFRGSILAIEHCVDNYVPGLLGVLEMPDLAGLVAPRALFVESGARDPIFPLPAFEEAVQRGREIYQAFGCPDLFGAETFDAEHEFHGEGAFAFLEGRLRASDQRV